MTSIKTENNHTKRKFVLYVFVFLTLFSLISGASSLEIVSIGGACNIARAARHNNLRTIAYPLDWMITPMASITAAFEDDFAHVLMPEEMHENEDGKSVIDGYGFVYIHDFPTVRYPEAPEDGEIMPVHQLHPEWRNAIPIVQAKFRRRLERLLNLLNTGKPVALVRYNEMNRDNAKEFVELLKKKFPKAYATLVVIGNTPEFQEPWNLPHICNLYINENDWRAWNGPAWGHVMHTIAALQPTPWTDATFTRNGHVLTSPIYNPGLFSAFNTVIGALDFYDRGCTQGLRVDFAENGWYYDPAKGRNWWNYYFEPIAVGEVTENGNEQLFPTYQKISFAYDAQFEMPCKRAHELIQKYVHVRPHIAEQIDAFCNQHFADSFVIGVHYRGTDKLEADPVTYDTVATYIRTAIAEHPGTRITIFAATDDAHFATYIQEQFPHLLIMRDALRSDSATGVHMRNDLAPYKKGEDAVIDCLLLSRCSMLIKMASNLSDCSLQFNPNIPVIRLNKSFSE